MIYMANYHLEVQTISRGNGRSLTKLASYICGRNLHDSYWHETCYNNREDVLYTRVFQPAHAPAHFYDIQSLCDEIEGAERRYDARTAREFKGSLPNELPLSELELIVEEFVETHFTSQGLCAIAAIHEGRNTHDPSKNNPHVHIIVSTRTVGADGFHKKKDREHDAKRYLTEWREGWARVQNLAYERNGLDVRISHESHEVEAVDRDPTNHISRIDWQREQCGERTVGGDKRRAIRNRNLERLSQDIEDREHSLEREVHCR